MDTLNTNGDYSGKKDMTSTMCLVQRLPGAQWSFTSAIPLKGYFGMSFLKATSIMSLWVLHVLC